jgi:ADP-ribose pyrophosphatase YjhB (NUDIX family)
MVQLPVAAPHLAPPPHLIAYKRVAAGALFLDESGRILLVNPTYKPLWEIPGGMVEADEAPSAACRREILEEIGLTIVPEILLSIGYLQANAGRSDALRFIFWGGVLDAATSALITLQAAELSEYAFVTLDEAAAMLRPTLHAQLAQCLANVTALAHGAIPQNYWEET